MLLQCILQRTVTPMQFVGVAFIVISISLVKLPDLISGVGSLPMNAVYLACVASLISGKRVKGRMKRGGV